MLAGKHVLLTGALGTLGRAQAAMLRVAGARLTLIDLPSLVTEGDAFARDLGETVFRGIDLGDLAALGAAAAAIADDRRVDILINNAAMIVNRPFADFSLEEYEAQIRVNSSAAFALAQAVSPAMIAAAYGKIVNFCSVTLNGRWDGYVPYVTSKGAMLGLTKSLARELGRHGVCVNAVSPGAVVSQAEERVFGDRRADYAAWVIENQCLKRRIVPDDVARLVLFLVSPGSDMISGQNIHVDGGW